MESLLNTLKRIIFGETIYGRSYIGIVMLNIDSDPLSGAVHCAIPELGWVTPESWGRCLPSSMTSYRSSSMIIPAIGDIVEIYFLGWDPNKPRYQSVLGTTLLKFDGLPTTYVIFESPLFHSSIVVDDLTGITTIDSVFFKLNLGTQPMVLGTALMTFLTTLVTQLNVFIGSFNVHTHIAPPLGGATGPPIPIAIPAVPPTPVILSLRSFLD